MHQIPACSMRQQEKEGTVPSVPKKINNDTRWVILYDGESVHPNHKNGSHIMKVDYESTF